MTSIGSTVEKSSSVFYSAPRIPADAIFALTAECLQTRTPKKSASDKVHTETIKASLSFFLVFVKPKDHQRTGSAT
ncbi:hypothetical protein IFM47457_10975 [Aspergillus lentulus]|nr:hypothetical protein IFM47457_10975 [Aspergillus lentulus]